MRRKLTIGGAVLILAAAVAAALLVGPWRERQALARLAAGDETAVEAFAQRLSAWSADDPRRHRLLAAIVAAYPDFTPHGQRAVLRLAETGRSPDLVRAGLNATDAAACELAIMLAMRTEEPLAPEVVELLRDDRVEVRRAALLALGPMREMVDDQAILPLLHDVDADVAGLAEAVLRGRGLSERQLRLARLITDPSPMKRLEVIHHLPSDRDLDPKVWLHKLSEDPSPVVRAGAARAALDPATGLGIDLNERVRQMAQRDPDGTVRQIAEYLIRARSGATPQP